MSQSEWTDFSLWLVRTKGVAAATAATYVSQATRILRDLAQQGVVVNEQNVAAYINALPESHRSPHRVAWNALGAYMSSRGVSLPSASNTETSTEVPEEIQEAARILGKHGLGPTILPHAVWPSIKRVVGLMGVVDVREEGKPLRRLAAPSRALETLAHWAGNTPGMPVLPRAPGSSEPMPRIILARWLDT